MSSSEILSNQSTLNIDDSTCAVTNNASLSSSSQSVTTAVINNDTNLDAKHMTDPDKNTKALASESDTKPSNNNNNFHLIKWIEFNYEELPILLQNVNGPCPLLAIFNTLLLRKLIVLNPNADVISTERVIALLAEYILEQDQSKLSDEDRANYEHNVQDALSVLDKLKTGLDVNLKFDGVDKFEYTRECIVFDLLHIQLYHGWVIDPQDTELRTIVTADAPSYNQLVEKMIRQRHSDREELVRESLLIEQFLEENRSQLTHYGILQLNQTMRDNQLAVFFRNNHFNTIWKNQNQLLILVSDQGYFDHKSIVFETLTDIDNDSLFTNGYGRIWRKPEPAEIEQDRDLAIAMQNEEKRLYHEAQLQQQQNRQQSTEPSSQSSFSSSRQSKKAKDKPRRLSNDHEDKDSCSIL